MGNESQEKQDTKEGEASNEKVRDGGRCERKTRRRKGRAFVKISALFFDCIILVASLYVCKKRMDEDANESCKRRRE